MSQSYSKVSLHMLIFLFVAGVAFIYGQHASLDIQDSNQKLESKTVIEKVISEEEKENFKNSLGSISNYSFSKEEYDKWAKSLEEVVEKEDPLIALNKLQSYMSENAQGRRDCHNLTHKIGETAYEKYQDPVKAFEYRKMVCGYGYIHGVISSYLIKNTDPFGSMTRLCEEYSSLRDKLECYHAMGHALMIYSSNDLPSSLSICDNFSNVSEQAACGQGVFMENFLSDKDHPSEYVLPQDPLYPCREQKEVHKPNCYRLSVTYYLTLNDQNFSKVLSWCSTGEVLYKDWCVRGAVQNFIQYTFDIPTTEKFCLNGDEGQVEPCVKEIVRLDLQARPREEVRERCRSKFDYTFTSNLCLQASYTETQL